MEENQKEYSPIEVEFQEHMKKYRQQIATGHRSLEDPESQAIRQKYARDEWIAMQNDRMNDGYRALLVEIYRNIKNGSFSASDELQPISLEECLIKQKNVEFLQNPDKLVNFFAEGKTLQILFGYTNNVLLNLFEISKKFFDEKNYADAINAFTFLTSINPTIAAFWISLGMSLEANQNFSEALEVFETAMVAEPEDFDAYLCMIRCCQALKEYSPIKDKLHAALENAGLKDQAEEALMFISAEEQAVRHGG